MASDALSMRAVWAIRHSPIWQPFNVLPVLCLPLPVDTFANEGLLRGRPFAWELAGLLVSSAANSLGAGHHLLHRIAHAGATGQAGATAPRALVSAIPAPDPDIPMTASLTGEPADPGRLPSGCAFHPRCFLAFDRCRQETPEPKEFSSGRWASCHALDDGLEQGETR